jgi:hypothetical protein
MVMENADRFQSTSLVRSWVFRTLLLMMALCCFVVTFADTVDRLNLSTYGIPATIETARAHQQLPTQWSDYAGQSRSLFHVRLKERDGKESATSMYLPRDAVEALLKGELRQIVFVRDNPQRFLLAGEALPAFGLLWLLGGVIFFAIFLYSLKLR